jgi:putative flavoprotein involved in K+ transport
MRKTDVAIVGAGQAGLAMSRSLAAFGVDHVLLERGKVADRWRRIPWEALRLITPNWMTRLPGHQYDGPEPDSFMDRDAVVTLLEAYARASAAPVEAGTRVERVSGRQGGGFRIDTDRGGWAARAVVIATGACDQPATPDWATRITSAAVIHASAYRRPKALPSGAVLVVGASASGAQIAREIRAAGRAVTLAVGRHVRMPRRYRGRDIMAWLDWAGLLDTPWHAMSDLAAARRSPSLQLTGRGGDLSLERLAAEGIRLVGRVTGADSGRLTLARALPGEAAASEARLARLLDRIDAHIAAAGHDAPAAVRSPPFMPPSGPAALDLRSDGVGTVILATGHRRDYRWLDLPVLDRAGEIRHEGGITPAPGLFALGLRFLRRRSSSFIDGVGRDAEELAPAIAALLGATCRAA